MRSGLAEKTSVYEPIEHTREVAKVLSGESAGPSKSKPLGSNRKRPVPKSGQSMTIKIAKKAEPEK